MRNTLIFFLISLLIIGCKDETTTTSTIHDPSKPVQITGFEPTEGGARTRLYIQGNNFGSNTDDIKVKIGGLPAKVIGSNGNIIYCMVPFKASEGTIEVSIKGQDPITAAEKFNYVSKTIVGTVAGYVDETGKVKVQDGSFKPTAHMARTMKNLLSVLRGENTDAETPREVAIVVMTEASTK